MKNNIALIMVLQKIASRGCDKYTSGSCWEN